MADRIIDFDAINQYLDEKQTSPLLFYQEEVIDIAGAIPVSIPFAGLYDLSGHELRNINLWLNKNDSEATSFQKMLTEMLKANGYEHNYPSFYKKADIDRRLFAKMASETYAYHPDIKTVFKCIIGLESNIKDAEQLLKSAAYYFGGSRFNLLIQYCIENKIYDHSEIDEILSAFGEETLYSIK